MAIDDEVQWVRRTYQPRTGTGTSIEDLLQRIADRASAAPADGPVPAQLAAQAKDLALQLKDVVTQIKQVEPNFFSARG